MSDKPQPAAPSDEPTYETAKQIAKSGSFEDRAQLAGVIRSWPELLVFLAADSSPRVREAVARNPHTPVAAYRLLAQDTESLIRLAVARSLANLWPDYEVSAGVEVREVALQALEVLAIDQALKVREALSGAIKDLAYAPPKIVNQLASDIARTVAEPILRHYARLDEETLVGLALNRREDWAQQALAQRPQVPSRLAAALLTGGDRDTVRLVLENDGADIPDDLLMQLAEESRLEPSWQPPLVRRPLLPRTVAVRLAEFVDIAAFDILRARGDFDEALTAEIVAVARRRLDWADRYGGTTPGADRAQAAFRDGKLNESMIGDAVAWNDRDFVIPALALLANVTTENVRAILAGGSAHAIVALVWRARLSMRLALQMEKTLANIPAHKLIYAHNGTDFPLGETEMLWHLEFFGCQL